MLRRLKVDIEDLVKDHILPIIPKKDFKNCSTFIDREMAGGQIVKVLESECVKQGLNNKQIKKKVFGSERYERSIKYAINDKNLKGNYSVTNNNKTIHFEWDIGNPSYGDAPGEERLESGNSNNSVLYIDDVIDAMKKGSDNIVRFIPSGIFDKTVVGQEMKKYGYGYKLAKFLGDAMSEVKVRGGFVCVWLVKGYLGDVKVTPLNGKSYTQDRNNAIKNISQSQKIILEKISKFESISKRRKNGDVSFKKGAKGSIQRIVEGDETFSKTKTKKHNSKVIIYVGGWQGAKILWDSKGEAESSKVDKVVIGTATDRYTIGRALPSPKGEGVSRANYYFETDNIKRLSDYFEGRIADGLVPWIVKLTKYNDTVSTNVNSFNHIPDLDQFDPKKPILDQLGLTEEQKNEIANS
jgi:hypothetical protein